MGVHHALLHGLEVVLGPPIGRAGDVVVDPMTETGQTQDALFVDKTSFATDRKAVRLTNLWANHESSSLNKTIEGMFLMAPRARYNLLSKLIDNV